MDISVAIQGDHASAEAFALREFIERARPIGVSVFRKDEATEDTLGIELGHVLSLSIQALTAIAPVLKLLHTWIEQRARGKQRPVVAVVQVGGQTITLSSDNPKSLANAIAALRLEEPTS